VLEQVSRSSCHNYFMNVTDFGYNLVVDLDTRTPSSQLFLLVKASPILRHSLEDEHNYASYYQFKKQGDHHGVVVTSEHLSPGRWYIGVCNYVQEVALFDDKRTASQQSSPFPDDAAYTVVATLNRTREKPPRTAAESETDLKTEHSEPLADARSVEQSGCLVERRRSLSTGDKVDNGKTTKSEQECKKQISTVADAPSLLNSGLKHGDKDERKQKVGGWNEDEDQHAATRFWAGKAEALEKELERVRAEMQNVKGELTSALSQNKPAVSDTSLLTSMLDEELGVSKDDSTLLAPTPTHPATGRRRRMLTALPQCVLSLVPYTLLPGGALCDDMGICILGVSIGLLLTSIGLGVALAFKRHLSHTIAVTDEKLAAHSLHKPHASSATSGASTSASAASSNARRGKAASKGASPCGSRDKRVDTSAAREHTCEAKPVPVADDEAQGTQNGRLSVGSPPPHRVGSLSDVEKLERRCGELQEEIDLERQKRALEGTQKQEAEKACFQARKVEELKQALQDANARVHALETSSRRWKEDAQAAAAHISRISREKAAAERAAEVLQLFLTQANPAPASAGAGFDREGLAAATSMLEPGSGDRGDGAGAESKRRPPVVSELDMMSYQSAYSIPFGGASTPDRRLSASSAPKTPLPTVATALSPQATPLQSTGLAPIGTPPSHMSMRRHMASNSVDSPASSILQRNLGSDHSFERTGSDGEIRWLGGGGNVGGRLCTPMDGSAFAAFMGLDSSLNCSAGLLDCSLPLEALEGDTSCSSLILGCGAAGCGVELCDSCIAREAQGSSSASGAVGEEGGCNMPTRARGRRGGRRQKRVGAEGNSQVQGQGESGLGERDGDERRHHLATSMALAALDGDE
jgi:hypothetical protein